jgi:hypothetical protein
MLLLVVLGILLLIRPNLAMGLGLGPVKNGALSCFETLDIFRLGGDDRVR